MKKILLLVALCIGVGIGALILIDRMIYKKPPSIYSEPMLTKEQLILQLHDIGAFKFGDFTFKSGLKATFYIDLRPIVSYPKLLREISKKIMFEADAFPFDIICGVPYSALPIATAASLNFEIPMIMKRKESKEHGTKQLIEGVFKPGMNCLVIEDLITSGASTLETIKPLEQAGLKVTDVIVVFDRQQGGKQVLEQMGYNVHALCTMQDLLDTLTKHNIITNEQRSEVETFVAQHQFGTQQTQVA